MSTFNMKQQNNDSKIAAAKIGFISRILIYITKDTKKKKKVSIISTEMLTNKQADQECDRISQGSTKLILHPLIFSTNTQKNEVIDLSV